MSSYSPPIENVAIFDTINFSSGETVLTQSAADKRYLRFPNAQGTENLAAINVNGLATFNTNIVQNGITTITQTDNTVNTTPNNLRPTHINGDLTLFRPTTANGGSFRAFDVSSTSGYSVQIYQSGLTSNFIDLAPNGTINLTAENSSGTQKQLIKSNATTGTLIQTDKADSGLNAQLSVVEIGTGRRLDLTADNTNGNGNPIVSNGDNTITSRSGIPLTITSQSATTNGIRITNTSAEIGAGGTGSTPTTYFLANGTNSIIEGPASFTSTTPPISSQTIPASNDSSNKIPTTAWVQSAISSSSSQFVPKFKNYTNVQTTSGSGYSSGINVSFNGTWNTNDVAYFRVTSQVSYTDTGSGYQNTGNSMGVLLVRPHYTTSNWGGVSPGVSTIVEMCNNSPNTVMGADQKIAFYTPCYNIGGVQNFIISGGVKTLQFGVLSFQTTGGWAYFLSVEYIGAYVSAGGTVVLSNGSGNPGQFTNDTLP